MSSPSESRSSQGINPKIATRVRALSALCAVSMLLSACTYGVTPSMTSDIQIPSAYAYKVKGTWAIAIMDRLPTTEIAPDGFACGAFNYTMDVDPAFRRTMLSTYRQVVDDAVWSDHVLTAKEIKQMGYAGEIVINAPTLVPDINFTQTSAIADVKSNMALGAHMAIITPEGVIARKNLSGTGQSFAPAGIICQDAAESISHAADSAVQELVSQSASEFANSREVRSVASVWRPAAH